MSNLLTTQVDSNSDVINFGIGQPQMEILPTAEIEQAAAHRLSQQNPFVLAYGNEAGDGLFRLALAHFLSNRYGEPVDAEQLVVTAGISQAMDMLCTVLTQAGDTVFVEEPTYFLVRQILLDHQLNVVSLPIDENGLMLDALEEALKEHTPKFVYTIPTFHNPSTVTMPAENRKRLVELSQAHGFYVVADEVYQLLNYGASPPAPLAAYVDTGSVISVSSFSKILAPGLRLGWIQTAPEVADQISGSGMLYSGGSISHFTSAVVRSALELGLQDQYLAELKRIYGRRVKVMAEAIEAHLPEITFACPTGGFFFWLKLPDSVDVDLLREQAVAHKVDFMPGYKASNQDQLHEYIRLSFAFYDEPTIGAGIERLAAAMKALQLV